MEQIISALFWFISNDTILDLAFWLLSNKETFEKNDWQSLFSVSRHAQRKKDVLCGYDFTRKAHIWLHFFRPVMHMYIVDGKNLSLLPKASLLY